MNSTSAAAAAPRGTAPSNDERPRVRRVRHQARETAAVMGFSAACSCTLALFALLLMSLVR